MLRYIVSIITRSPFNYIVRNRKILSIGIKTLRRFPSTIERMLKTHTYSNYLTIAKTYAEVLPSSIYGVYTGRFCVITEPITLHISKFPLAKTGNTNEKEIIRSFTCFIEELLDEVENKDLENAIEMLKHKLSNVLNGNEKILKSFVEEYIHSRIFRGTNMWHVIDLLSWRERFLEMYIAEKIHRRVEKLPRFPEKEFNRHRALGDMDNIKKYFIEIREEIEKAVDDDVIKAFEKLIVTLFFQRYLYPYTVLPFIEVPTWVIMERKGFMDQGEVDYRIDFYFRDKNSQEIAEEMYSRLKEKTSINEIVNLIKIVLSPPLNELTKTVNDAVNKKDSSIIIRYFMDRFNSISSSSRSKQDKLHQSSLTPLDLAKIFDIDIDDFIEVVVDVFLRRRDLFENFYLKKLKRPYEYVGVVLSLKITDGDVDKTIPMIFIDKWSGSCHEEDSSSNTQTETDSTIISTMEHLVGSIPRAIRTYVILRELTMTMEIGEALSIFIESLPGRPKSLIERFGTCLENVRDFKYKGLVNYAEVDREDVANLIAGTAFMLACVGDFGYGVHGIHM